MAIRLRTVGNVRVALCAAETDAKPGDVYLDDGDHRALTAKFSHDWKGQEHTWPYPEEWAAMDTQKLRDAKVELERWMASQLLKLTDAQKRALVLLPDSGGQEAWRLKGVSISTLRALERRDCTEVVHRDVWGEKIFDCWCRTRKGRDAL